VLWVNPADSRIYTVHSTESLHSKEMAYTVLARKYRSQTFQKVIGQDPIVKTLQNAIKNDRVAHAYLFAGTRGIGKTTMARLLAKALNCLACEKPTTEPCCKCDSCVAINQGQDIDVIEIDGATNNGVEEVRRLRENAAYRPARSRFKIYIIDEVHMLSNAAFNALLKTLEEPPEHIKFIFATTEPNKVIPTIQSRCQRFDFANINPRQIADQLRFILRQENITYHEDLILPLAKMANGSMRDALSLLDRLISTGEQPLTTELLEQFLGCPNRERIYHLLEQIAASDAAAALNSADELLSSGLSETQIADALIDTMRDLMLARSAGADSELLVLTAEQKQKARQLAEKFDLAAIIYNITALEKVRWNLKNSDYPRTILEACLLRLTLAEHFLNIDELLRKNTTSTKPAVKKNDTSDQTHIPSTRLKATTLSSAAPDDVLHNWPGFLQTLAPQLGSSINALLAAAVPTRFENDTLTITFSSSAEIYEKMCQSNGRTEQIEHALTAQCGRPIKLHIQTDADRPADNNHDPSLPKTNSRKKDEILNHPAVKTVLTGLDATVRRIEQNQ